MTGLRVWLTAPDVPSCADCRRWVYATGERWRRTLRGGRPVPRPPGLPLPCRQCAKSPDGRPNPGADLGGRLWRALQLYHQVKAGLPLPADGIAVRNCGVIEMVLREVERSRPDPLPLLGAFLGAVTRGMARQP